MEQGWDPDVKQYFKKILFSICFSLFWMMAFVCVGLYAGLAYPSDRPVFAVVIFYLVMLTSFLFLLRYLLRAWRK